MPIFALSLKSDIFLERGLARGVSVEVMDLSCTLFSRMLLLQLRPVESSCTTQAVLTVEVGSKCSYSGTILEGQLRFDPSMFSSDQ
jgi:hypothetical protein